MHNCCVPHGMIVMFNSITTGSVSNQCYVNTLSHLGHVEAITAHHSGAQNHGQRVCNVLTTNVRRGTMHLRSPSRSQSHSMLLSSLLVTREARPQTAMMIYSTESPNVWAFTQRYRMAFIFQLAGENSGRATCFLGSA